jgi:hypothetical protein
MSALPSISDINLFRYRQSVVHVPGSGTAMGAASVSEIALFRRLPGVLRVWDIIITAPPSAVIGD